MTRISPRKNRRAKSGVLSNAAVLPKEATAFVLRIAFGAAICWLSFLIITSTFPMLKGDAITDSAKSLRGAEEDTCRFYLAESAVPKSGLGLFTTIDIKKGERAQPIIDHCVYVADKPERTHFHTHSWSPGVFFGAWEGDNPWAACEGFATLFNSRPIGHQTSKLKLLFEPDNAGLRRSESPGAGASTHYYGVTSEAVRSVPAGSELTIDYGDWSYDDGDYEKPRPTRDVSWLRKYGMCIDNIRSKPATDPAMGRGGFAAYNLKKGTVVAPAPLQVFPDRKVFKPKKTEALFVNYCFSLDNGMLLYPYGPGVTLINHSKTPNVGLRWSSHHMHHASWLELPLDVYLKNHDYPGGLILDYVALRDIIEGEELFLDYGDEWQAAWEVHVRNWKPVKGDGYVYRQDMTRDIFPTLKEQEENPLPPNLKTVCWTAHLKPPKNVVVFDWEEPTAYEWPDGMLSCDILERRAKSSNDKDKKTTSFEYVVRMYMPTSDERTFIETAVPAKGIYYVDRGYASDMNLPIAFRQPMTFPKELIPATWK